MRVVRSRDELSAARDGLPGPVGFVPTMGALHAGHLALAEAARAACASTVASIFVNPTQFSSAQDSAGYPRDEAGDLEKLASAGCDLAWLPGVEDLYPPCDATFVDVAGPALDWEGRFRPGHFRGVATVVTKLFGLVRADVACFGEKDWQQLQVVRRMVADLVLPIRIIGVPTVREPDGLAMSSRNRFLDASERATAPVLYGTLQHLARELHAGTPPEPALTDGVTRLTQAGFGVDYLALVEGPSMRPTSRLDGSRLIATARLGPIRLLDNIAV